MHQSTDYSLFTNKGERKYLNRVERERFYNATLRLPLEKRLFCLMFYYTGARLNEIAQIEKVQIDHSDRKVILRTLKQRKANVFRQMSLPDYVLEGLDMLCAKNKTKMLWSFSSRSGARYIKTVMADAGIEGIKSNARGLRHGYAVHAVTRAPLTQVQKWLGHAYLETTAIYLNVCGREEREWAEKVWE